MTKTSCGVECQLADPCRQCMHGAKHPPVIFTYDESAGDYRLETGRICMARWASTNGEHAAGHICGLPVFRSAGELGLCQHHYWRFIDWRHWDRPREEIEEKIRALEEADRQYEQAMLESKIHRQRVDLERSCVYYFRRVSDGMIKIGTTTEFRQRMATHRREHGEIQILLTHSGGPREESEIHRKLDVYRSGRSEWFHPSRPLLSYILDTRRVWTHKKMDGLDLMTRTELQKLIVATPPDAYHWRRGRLVPVKRATPPAA